MGLIATLLEWARGSEGDTELADAKCDPGGGDIVTAGHFQGAGVDSHPLPGDYVLLVPGPEIGSYVVAGYLDPGNAGTARAGEVSLYLRDTNGAVQGELYLAESEPDWKATAGALIARADKVDAELAKIAADFVNLNTKYDLHSHAASGADPPSNKPLASEYTSNTAVGAEKGWVT